MNSTLTVLDYGRIVWRARAWVVTCVLASVLAAIVFAQLQPQIYGAKATVLPPRESAPQSLGASLGMLMVGGGGKDGMLNFPALLGGGGAVGPNHDMIAALVRSRSLRQEVVAALSTTWGADVGAKIVVVKADASEKGALGIVVEARDPRLAAETANAYVHHLDLALQRFADQSTRRRQTAYAAQLDKAAKGVEVAEEALLRFQTENRVLLNPEAQTKGAAEATVALRSSIMSLEMQREVLRLRYTDQHPQMQELQKQIAEMKMQYSKALFGTAMDLPPESAAMRGVLRKEFFVPAAKLTPVQFSMLKLYRNLKMEEAFYTGALQGLQQLQYGANQTLPSIEVLDPAEPSPVPIRPNKLFITLAGVAAGIIVGLAFAFVQAHIGQVRVEERERARRLPVLGDTRVEAQP